MGYIRKYGFFVLLITVVAIEVLFLSGCSKIKPTYVAMNVLSGQQVSDICTYKYVSPCGVSLKHCVQGQEFQCLTNVVILTTGTP
jgi:hypothetical protein